MKSRLSLAVALCLLASGCDDTKNPLSDPKTQKPDNSLIGVWREKGNNNELTYYKVEMAGGKLPDCMVRITNVTALIAPQPDVTRETNYYLAFPAVVADKNYLNIILDQAFVAQFEKDGWTPGKVNSYFVLRYEVKDGKAQIWAWDGEAKKKAIDAGKLKGIIEKHDNYTTVRFTDTTENLVRFVAASGDSLLAKEPAKLDRFKDLLSLENTPIDQLPDGWATAKTGQGDGSVWKVVEDATAPGGPKVLKQTSAAGSGKFFNLCVDERLKFADPVLGVSFKAVAGKEDQGGGLVWRYRDANNYYVARMNPLEDNFRVYKVVEGKRVQLATADVKAPAGQWHNVCIAQEGDHIRCYLNGTLYLDVRDSTFRDPGKIGLWTKADAQTEFQNLTATLLGK